MSSSSEKELKVTPEFRMIHELMPSDISSITGGSLDHENGQSAIVYPEHNFTLYWGDTRSRKISGDKFMPHLLEQTEDGARIYYLTDTAVVINESEGVATFVHARKSTYQGNKERRSVRYVQIAKDKGFRYSSTIPEAFVDQSILKASEFAERVLNMRAVARSTRSIPISLDTSMAFTEDDSLSIYEAGERMKPEGE